MRKFIRRLIGMVNLYRAIRRARRIGQQKEKDFNAGFHHVINNMKADMTVDQLVDDSKSESYRAGAQEAAWRVQLINSEAGDFAF